MTVLEMIFDLIITYWYISLPIIAVVFVVGIIKKLLWLIKVGCILLLIYICVYGFQTDTSSEVPIMITSVTEVDDIIQD